MKIKVKITKDHIDHAVRNDSHHCMIADALHTCNPNAQYVSVDLQSIQWSDKASGYRYTALTPHIAQVGLIAFDNGRSISPFMFTVHSIKESPMGWRARHPNSKPRNGKKYRITGKRRPRTPKKVPRVWHQNVHQTTHHRTTEQMNYTYEVNLLCPGCRKCVTGEPMATPKEGERSAERIADQHGWTFTAGWGGEWVCSDCISKYGQHEKHIATT